MPLKTKELENDFILNFFRFIYFQYLIYKEIK